MAKTRSAKISRQSATNVMGVDNIKKPNRPIKHVSWRDEQGGVGLTAVPIPELAADPAILAVNPKFRYGKEELLKLRDVPLSQRKPDFLDINEVSPTIWDPTRWNLDRKKSDTPTENGARNGDEHRRRPGDPRERLRKENDGIVLSPQRRSFNSGCCVPGRNSTSAAVAGNHRPHSPLGGGGGGKNDSASHHLGGGGGGVRDIQTTSRRIGSGRILRDPWDFGGDKQESNDNDYNFRPQQRGGDGSERRSFGRDYDRDKDKDSRRSGGRFGDRRRLGDRDEEPEWFSSGPSSQNDTIELRGFDESDRLGKKKMSPSQAKRARDWFKKKSEVASVTEEKEELSIEGGPDGRSTPTPQAVVGEGGGDKEAATNEHKTSTGGGGDTAKNTETRKLENGEGDGKHNSQQEKNLNDQSHFFEDILKCDSIPGLGELLPNGVGGDGDTNGKSRFSKWFTMENNNQSDSRRSSIQDEAIIKNLLKDLNEPSVSIPGDSSSYFAPISPAANTGTGLGGASNASSNAAKSLNILEVLQRGKQNDSLKAQVSGRILNLNEIEAKMRQNVTEAPPQMHKHSQRTEEDLTAFNRLLANMSSHHGGGVTASNGPMKTPAQPMSLMEMLSHSQLLDEQHARMSQQLLGSASPGAAAVAGASTPHDLAARLQQVQNQQKQQQQVEMLTKLMNAGLQVRASPLPEMGLQQSRELLSRPEAQAILQALHQRIPSPRELQVHTQNILQRALIKKKLEEQQENYRKKQEMQQRGQSPNNNANGTNNNNNNGSQPTKSVSSPTPLAFTPTSVLRKMTAEKDEGSKDVSKLVDGVKQLSQGRAVTGMRPPSQQAQQPPAQQQSQWPPYQLNLKQAGRPIVKANNFQPQQSSQQQQEFFTQQQQQKFLSQLQQMQQPRKTAAVAAASAASQQSQYHGPPPPTSHGSLQGHHSQYSNPTNSQQFSQLTQQQLRAQHQQHARPASQAQQQYGGNQQGTAAWQQYLNPQQQTRGQVGRGGVTDGDLSPTSNQLTRWFSHDLLERARGGELPSTAGLSQHLLSLEEIERLTAPPVHN